MTASGDDRRSGRASATDRGDPWPGVERLVAAVLADAAGVAASSLAAVGVGCGGPMAPGGEHVSPLNIEALAAASRCGGGSSRLTGLDVFIDNDAKALALAEGWVGAAVGRA